MFSTIPLPSPPTGGDEGLLDEFLSRRIYGASSTALPPEQFVVIDAGTPGDPPSPRHGDRLPDDQSHENAVVLSPPPAHDHPTRTLTDDTATSSLQEAFDHSSREPTAGLPLSPDLLATIPPSSHRHSSDDQDRAAENLPSPHQRIVCRMVIRTRMQLCHRRRRLSITASGHWYRANPATLSAVMRPLRGCRKQPITVAARLL